jgi:hypothetical protein
VDGMEDALSVELVCLPVFSLSFALNIASYLFVSFLEAMKSL